MTVFDQTPYWPAAEDWAGFLLVIVPAGPLPVPGEELCRRVRAQVETDAVLYDLVTVALAPPFEPTAGWGRAFVASMVKAAMPGQHFFAPRGVIWVVVVASNKQARDDAVAGMRGLPLLSRLWVRLFGAGVRADPRTGVSPTSVLNIASTVQLLIELYDEQPQVATAEPAFLDQVNALVEGDQLSLADLEPDPPARQPAEPETQVVRPAVAARVTVAPAAQPPPGPAPSVDAQPPPAVQPSRRLVEAVVYDGAEVVTVDQRTPRQRLTRQNPTDADCLDELRRDGRSAALVYLVFVPDDGVVARPVAKRRNAIALELDQALASVQLDTATGQPARVAVEVLLATNPVQKHGVLRMAGDLTESTLPKVRIEYHSVAETTEPLLDAASRTSRALRARGVEVVSLHFVFLAAMRFPADETTEDSWSQLLEQARVTWIDFSPADRRQLRRPMPPSPFGLHVLTDKEDVVAVIKKQSEIIYRYAPPDRRMRRVP